MPRYDIKRFVPILLIAVLFLLFILARSRDTESRPAIDLLRVEFPTSGLTISEHGSKRLYIVTEDWTLSVGSADSQGAENVRDAFRRMAASSADCRLDVLSASGAPTIHRLLRGIQGPQRAIQVQYLIRFPDGWADAGAYARTAGEPLNYKPIDDLLLAFRLAQSPRAEAEVVTPWRAYQQRRLPGSPIAKFVLYMDPAPVRIGNFKTGSRDRTVFTESDFKRGGRQIAPDLFEFYSKGDPSSIRVDLWMDRPPDIEGREAIFEATLRLEDPKITLWSFVEPYDAPVPAGNYKVAVSLVNRGRFVERTLTDDERFSRDDLERYEVVLKTLGPPHR